MQPLAIQQLSIPIEAGDAGSAGTPQSNNGGGVVFNELMSAARITADDRRASDQEMASRRAADQAKNAQEDRETENAVAALSAAAQFAANNVRLKQRVAAERSIQEEAARRAAEDKAAAEKSTQEDDTHPAPEQTINGSSELPDMAAEQSTGEIVATDNSLQSITPGAKSKDANAPRASEEMTGQASNSPATDEAIQGDQGTTPVGRPTGEPTANMAATSVIADEAMKTLQVNQPPSKSEKIGVHETTDAPDIHNGAGLTRTIQPTVLQTEANDQVSTAQVKTDEEASTHQPQHQAEDETKAEFDQAVADKKDEIDASVEPIQQIPPVAQTIDTSAIAALVATSEIKNTNAAPVKTDPVLAPARAQNADQSILQNKGSFAKETAQQSPPANATPENAAMAAIGRDGRRNFTTDALEIRSVSKFDADASTSGPEASPAFPPDMEPTTSLPTEGSSQLQKAIDQGLGTALKTKIDPEPNLRTNVNQHSGEGVSLGELEKLGVKDFALQVEVPMTTAPLTPELQAPPAAPTPTQAQIAGTMTPSSGSNTERRTIAADIRLRALERMVVAAARAGTDTLTLQLYPPALGQVMIRLVMDGQRLRIVTRAANAEAVNTLKGMEGDIREALKVHGLDLADFDVSDESQEDDDTQRQQSAAPARQTSNGKKNETFTVDLNA